MPRPLRITPPGVPLHVIQRGNNRCAIFADPTDVDTFRRALDHARQQTGCAVHAYVFMTNHVHLVLSPPEAPAASKLMQILGRTYVRYFNDRHGRTGTLFEGRFRSSAIDSERYFLVCSRYVELNPVRAGMVVHPGDYRWSSFRHNALGASDPLIEAHPLYRNLGKTSRERLAAYNAFFDGPLEEAQIDDIRRATHLGSRITHLRRRAFQRVDAHP